jgi:hypothetical protein
MATELRAGDDLTMTVPTDEPVCIALPAALRDPAACAGLPLDNLPADTAQVVAYVRSAGDSIAVSIKKLPGNFNGFESSSAHDFSVGYVAGANKQLPAPLSIAEGSVSANTLLTKDGVRILSMSYEVSGADPKGPMRLVAHQHVYALPIEKGMEVVVWTTSDASAHELDELAAKSALTLHAARPAHSRSFNIGYAIGLLVGSAVPVLLALGIVWFVLARQRARQKQGQALVYPGYPPGSPG